MKKRTKRIVAAVFAGVGGVLVAAGVMEPELLEAITKAAEALLDALSSGSVTETME